MSRDSLDMAGFAGSSRRMYKTLYFTSVYCPIFRGEVDLLTCRESAFDKVDIKQCISSRCQSVIRPCPACLSQGEFDRIGICEGTFRKPGKEFCDLHLEKGSDYVRTKVEVAKIKTEAIFIFKPQKQSEAKTVELETQSQPQGLSLKSIEPVEKPTKVISIQQKKVEHEIEKPLVIVAMYPVEQVIPEIPMEQLSGQQSGKVNETDQAPVVVERKMSTRYEGVNTWNLFGDKIIDPSSGDKENPALARMMRERGMDRGITQEDCLAEFVQEPSLLEASGEEIESKDAQVVQLEGQKDKVLPDDIKEKNCLQPESERLESAPKHQADEEDDFVKTVVDGVRQKSFTFMEKARVIDQLKGEYKLTFTKIAKMFGESICATIQCHLCLGLHLKIQKMLDPKSSEQQWLSQSSAIFIATHEKDQEKQLHLVEEIKKRGLKTLRSKEYILTQVGKKPDRSKRQKAIIDQQADAVVRKPVLAQAEELPSVSVQQAIAFNDH